MVRAVESTNSPSTSAEDVHFYSSSGGNAGLACATAAATLGRSATVIVPMSTSELMIGKLRELGAEVVQVGENWAAADRHLREVAIPEFERAHPGSRAVYVPPFDHPDVWDGNATLVDELKTQMSESFDEQVDAVTCSVGGGGLLCGIMQGVQKLKDSGYGSPKVLAVETEGGDSLNASIKAGELVTLPGITTIATSLGATRIAEQAFAWVERAEGDLISAVVTDKESVDSIVKFLDHARILVESACSATIATVVSHPNLLLCSALLRCLETGFRKVLSRCLLLQAFSWFEALLGSFADFSSTMGTFVGTWARAFQTRNGPRRTSS